MKESKKSKRGDKKQIPQKQKNNVILIRDLNAEQSKALDDYKAEISEKTSSKAMLKLLEVYPLHQKRIDELTKETHILLEEKEGLEDTISEYKEKIKRFLDSKQQHIQAEKELISLLK